MRYPLYCRMIYRGNIEKWPPPPSPVPLTTEPMIRDIWPASSGTSRAFRQGLTKKTLRRASHPRCLPRRERFPPCGEKRRETSEVGRDKLTGDAN